MAIPEPSLVIDEPSLVLVAVNDVVNAEHLAYRLRCGTTDGRYWHPLTVNGGDLVVDGGTVRTFSMRDPLELPGKERRVELVFEWTGVLTRRQDLEKHLRAGAGMVLIKVMSWCDNEWGYANQNAPRGGISDQGRGLLERVAAGVDPSFAVASPSPTGIAMHQRSALIAHRP